MICLCFSRRNGQFNAYSLNQHLYNFIDWVEICSINGMSLLISWGRDIPAICIRNPINYSSYYHQVNYTLMVLCFFWESLPKNFFIAFVLGASVDLVRFFFYLFLHAADCYVDSLLVMLVF